MKLMKRAGIYQASNYNVTFDPSKVLAVSYKWWAFVKVIKGEVVFNSYFYSPSTSKHQSKVRRLMHDLGIKVDRHVSFREGLQDVNSLKQLNALQKEQDRVNAERAEAKRIERNARAKQKRAERKARLELLASTPTYKIGLVDRQFIETETK